MSLLDKQEIEPKVVNVLLLDNEEKNKENEDVIIEEIDEKEEEKRQSSEGLRKRKESTQLAVFLQTHNK